MKNDHLTATLPPASSTHHGELSVSKPHDPSGSLGGSAASRHPPGHDAAGPPREPSQLPPNQLADAKTTTVQLLGQSTTSCSRREPPGHRPSRHSTTRPLSRNQLGGNDTRLKYTNGVRVPERPSPTSYSGSVSAVLGDVLSPPAMATGSGVVATVGEAGSVGCCCCCCCCGCCC